MPLTGLGTWQLHEPNLTPAIHEAIKTGYRHIDGAAIYGNEAEAGAALSTLFSQQLVTRNDVTAHDPCLHMCAFIPPHSCLSPRSCG